MHDLLDESALFPGAHPSPAPAGEAALRQQLSEMKALYQRTEQRRLMLETIVESLPSAVLVADLQGSILVNNREAEQLSGFPTAEIPTNPGDWPGTYGIHAPDGRVLNLAEVPLARALQGETVTAEEVLIRNPRRPAGTVVEANARPLKDAQGRPFGAVVVFTDINERIRASEALRRSEKRLKASQRELEYFKLIAEGTEDFVALAGLDRKVRYVNPAGRAAFGLASMEAVLETELLDYIFPEALAEATGEWLPSLLRDGHFNVEIKGRHFLTGAVVPMLWRAFLIRDPETGEPYAVAAMGPLLAGRQRIEAERAEQQQALAESEARYRQLADHNPALIFRCHNRPGWPMIYMSRAVETITGYPATAFTEGGRLWGDMLIPETVTQTTAEVDGQAADTGRVVVQYQIRHADGSIRWLEGNAQLVTLPDGSEGYEGAITDITERQRILEALAESEARYRQLSDDNPAALLRCRALPGWPMVYISKAVEGITGHAPERFIEQPLLGQLVLEDDVPQLLETIADQEARGENIKVRYRIRHPDGGIRWLEGHARPIQLPDGSAGYDGALTDITPQKLAELALAESESRYRQLSEDNPAVLLRCRKQPGWPMLYISQAIEKLTGHAPVEFTGQGLLIGSLIPEDDIPRLVREIAEQEAAGGDIKLRYRLRHRDGSLRWIDSRARSLTLPDGTPGYHAALTDVTETRLAELALADSELRYRQMADNNPTILFRCLNEPGWPMLYMSPAVEKITGYPARAFTDEGLVYTSLIPEAALPAMVESVYGQLARSNVANIEYPIRHRDGTIRWVSAYGVLQTFADGREGFEGAIAEITESRAATQQLAASEARHRLLADNSPVIIFRCRDEAGWPMLFMSKAAETITGYPASAFTEDGMLYASLVLPEDIAGLIEAVETQTARGGLLEIGYRIRHRDGGVRWLHVRARQLALPDGSRGYEGVIADVSQAARAERLLAESEARYRDLADNSPAILFRSLTAPGWPILYLSAACLEITGYHPEEFMLGEQPFGVLIPEQDREGVLADLAGQLALGDLVRLQYRIVRKDGALCWLEVNCRRIILADGREGFEGSATDITLRKHSEKQLAEHAEALERANAELDEFTYIASHDLKEPLRGIHNYARFLAEDYAHQLDDGGQHMLKAVGAQAERMQRLIEDLLAIARLGREPMQRVDADLDALVSDVLASLAFSLQEKKVAVRCQPLGHLACDRVRVAEVFRNLVTNALKYNDKPTPTIEIGRIREGGVEAFFVRDNGIGIKPEFHARVFAPFRRLHAKDAYGGGTGVGLTIVKRIVEAHGGHIRVESLPGAGATFLFTLSASPRT